MSCTFLCNIYMFLLTFQVPLQLISKIFQVPTANNTSSVVNSTAQLSLFLRTFPPCWWEDLSSSILYSGGWFLQTQTEEMVKQNREFILAKLVGFPIWIWICIVPLSWIFKTKLLYYFWLFFYFFFFSEWRWGVME